jgi:hypothetical protein
LPRVSLGDFVPCSRSGSSQFSAEPCAQACLVLFCCAAAREDIFSWAASFLVQLQNLVPRAKAPEHTSSFRFSLLTPVLAQILSPAHALVASVSESRSDGQGCVWLPSGSDGAVPSIFFICLVGKSLELNDSNREYPLYIEVSQKRS